MKRAQVSDIQPLCEAEHSAPDSSQRLQFKAALAHMPLSHQLHKVRPPLPIQFRALGTDTTTATHAVARMGLEGSSRSLPHLETIQHSFGRHDVSGIEAHVGGAAHTANAQMGSLAYATGHTVAFKQSPDLHTAAHEAAHVVQQRAGAVQLKGGIGQVGDRYEQHADAVADKVVRGESAESLLSDMAPLDGGGGQATDTVQHKMNFVGLGNDYAFIMGTLIRHAFRQHARRFRLRDKDGPAILATIAAPWDMPHEVEQMMKDEETDYGQFDLDRVEDLDRLFDLFKKVLPWRNKLATSSRGRLHAGSKAFHEDDPERKPLTSKEQSERGWAMLPMLSEYDAFDASNRVKQFNRQKQKEVVYKVKDGVLINPNTDKKLNSTKEKMDYSDIHRAGSEVAKARGIDLASSDVSEKDFMSCMDEAERIGPSLIFVMNAKGDIFAAKERVKVIHHSSFQAGGAVAGAGTLRTDAKGRINLITNISGHYKPGPAYLWQVVLHMRQNGVELTQVTIEVKGLDKPFENAEAFLRAFDPSTDPRWFDAAWALERLNNR